jgi:hypothetical protein
MKIFLLGLSCGRKCLQGSGNMTSGLEKNKKNHEFTKGLGRLTADANIATVLGSIPASSDTMESEGR